jgi:NTP pyrophosphatase (non-canonical NTP hydrolase)
MLSFKDFQAVSAGRNQAWQHGGSRRWIKSDYGNATAGEAGELMNYVKKLQRVLDGLTNVSDHTIADLGVLKTMIGREVCDVMSYTVLVCIEGDLDMGECCAAATISELQDKAVQWNRAEKALRRRPWILPDYGNDLEVKTGRLSEVLQMMQAHEDDYPSKPMLPYLRDQLKYAVRQVALCLGAICDELQLDMEQHVIEKYNAVSDRVGLADFKLAA